MKRYTCRYFERTDGVSDADWINGLPAAAILVGDGMAVLPNRAGRRLSGEMARRALEARAKELIQEADGASFEETQHLLGRAKIVAELAMGRAPAARRALLGFSADMSEKYGVRGHEEGAKAERRAGRLAEASLWPIQPLI